MTGVMWSDSGSGPAIVLLHAFPCDHRMWDPQVAALVDAGWRVLVPDLPGFGLSAEMVVLPMEDPALRVIVDALVADLLEMGVDRLVLGGLSVGGYLAMEWARRHPEMLAGLALCDTKATEDTPTVSQGRLAMADAVQADPTGTPQLLRERMLPGIVGATSHRERSGVLDLVGAWMDEAPPDTVAWYQRAMAARPDSQSTLHEVDAPVLVLWGEEDQMSDRDEQDVLLAAVREGRFVQIPQAGHLSAIENPQAVTDALVSFAQAVRHSTLDG